MVSHIKLRKYKVKFFRYSSIDLGNRLDQIYTCALLHCIKLQDSNLEVFSLQKYMHVHISKLGMHVHTVVSSLYKIAHNYFLLKIISRI
jgi:hypothetical protein